MPSAVKAIVKRHLDIVRRSLCRVDRAQSDEISFAASVLPLTSTLSRTWTPSGDQDCHGGIAFAILALFLFFFFPDQPGMQPYRQTPMLLFAKLTGALGRSITGNEPHSQQRAEVTPTCQALPASQKEALPPCGPSTLNRRRLVIPSAPLFL